MDEKVSYMVFEGEMVRQERTVKRLWIVILVLIILLTGTNGAWLYYEKQFESISMTQTSYTDGNGDVITNGTASGDINYGIKDNTDN